MSDSEFESVSLETCAWLSMYVARKPQEGVA
jgi:hypothetical protein